jgi:hypothetical protein
MRRTAMLALLLTAAPAVVHGQANDTTAVLATLERFTGALRAKDSLGMRAVLHEQARFTLLRPAPGGGVRVMVLDAATFPRLVSAPNGPVLDEPIRNQVVQIDADLATVWAEYQVRIAGKVSHCGYDAFHLVRQPDGWKILNVSDTFRREGCGAMW